MTAIDWMSQFTEAERNTMTDLARRNYQDMTQEELELYTRWNSAKALADAQFELEKQQREALTAQQLALAQQQTAAAIAAIEEMKDLAVAYYESTIPVIEGD